MYREWTILGLENISYITGRRLWLWHSVVTLVTDTNSVVTLFAETNLPESCSCILRCSGFSLMYGLLLVGWRYISASMFPWCCPGKWRYASLGENFGWTADGEYCMFDLVLVKTVASQCYSHSCLLCHSFGVSVCILCSWCTFRFVTTWSLFLTHWLLSSFKLLVMTIVRVSRFTPAH